MTALGRISVLIEMIDTSQDAVLPTGTELERYKRFLEQASRVLEEQSGRLLREATTTYEHSGDGTALLRLRYSPWANGQITTVTILPSTVVASSEWTNLNSEILRRDSGTWPLGHANIRILGTPGYDTTGWDTLDSDAAFLVPADIEEPICRQASEYWQRWSERATGEEITVNVSGTVISTSRTNKRGYVPEFVELLERFHQTVVVT